ncbi:MAG: hypothetical protein K1Y02_24780 [Candidatus Hydrogenedentes bacterium]|nr:hypothetical protein [Candidatus Hydrogenedentota bacterium]
METHPVLLISLIVVNVPVYFGLGKLLFGNWENFDEAVRFLFTPDVFSWIRGEGIEDWWAEMKLGLLVSSSFFAVLGEYGLIDKFWL